MTCACASPLIARGDFVAKRMNYKERQVREEQPEESLRSPRASRFEKENMEIGETIYVTTRDDFRTWFEKNHKTKKEIWLIQYKKATKKPSLNYVEAVEEGLCFGWIDGLEKSMDAERYALRFSPRRPKSNWTETNKERARKMIVEGKMTEAGLATLPSDV